MGAGGFVNQAFQNMVNWQWFHDVPVRILFEYLLHIVNLDDKTECGICIKSGSVLVTISQLEKATCLSTRQVRTALSKLSSTNEISVITSRQNGTIISITEWLKYKYDNAYAQNSDNASKNMNDKRTTNERQTEVVDNNDDTCNLDKQTTNKRQTNDCQDTQNEYSDKRTTNERQIENHDNQQVTWQADKRTTNERQTEVSSKEPEKEDIPPIPPIEVKDQEKDTIKEKNTKKEKATEYPFDMFWDLYDKKNDKQKCEALWAKLSEADRKACIEYLPAYVASTSGERKQYRRYPETFLRNRSWENELPVVYPQQQMLFPAQETPLQKALREADNY